MLTLFLFQARSSQDRENCILTGATYLDDGRMVLVDQMLRKLKLFDQNYKWMGEKVLPARPYDVTNVNENEIAVTFPREKRIQVFAGINLLNLLPNKSCFTCLQCKCFKNTVGKGEIACNELFSFSHSVSTLLENLLPFSSNLELSSANPLSSEESKICRFGKS